MRLSPASTLAAGSAVALAAAVGAVGADARWLAALGAEIVERGGVPDGVPYASAPSAGWENVLVLAELSFHALEGLGERGYLLAQLVAVAAGFGLLAVDARRRGATDAATAVVLLGVVVGAAASLAVIRVQLFSVLLVPATLLLLREETRQPSRRIWLLVPLLALWGNLHGAVLVGLALAAAYLTLERARREPLTALGVLAASVAALAANPALEGTLAYYRGVLGNEAARRGAGLWEPVDPTSLLGGLLVAAAVPLLVLAVRARPRPWELAALAGLALLTLRTERSGVWLLFAAAGPAAAALPVAGAVRRGPAAAAAAVLAAVLALGLVRGPIETGASDATLAAALRAADGAPILAEPALAEQLVAAGGRLWLGNPLDAFARSDQRLYLDWLEGASAGDLALSQARVVVVRPAGPADRRLRTRADTRRIAGDDRAVVYRRTG